LLGPLAIQQTKDHGPSGAKVGASRRVAGPGTAVCVPDEPRLQPGEQEDADDGDEGDDQGDGVARAHSAEIERADHGLERAVHRVDVR
jgi:hypothetical protein